MKRWTMAVAVAAALVHTTAAEAVEPVTVEFQEPGGRMFTVPKGVTSLHVVAVGAKGGRGGLSPGGNGARVSADLAVTPGERLWVEVGAPGGMGGISSAGLSPGGEAGAGGGGRGGIGGPVEPWRPGEGGGGGGGGGASLVRGCLAEDLTGCTVLPGAQVVAAGGGGGAAVSRGGDAGTPLGVAGESGMHAGGGGGALSSGGSSPLAGGAGSFLQGGAAVDFDTSWNASAHDAYYSSGGGGGGGGYYGGGAGRYGWTTATGGGGGSSYGPPGATFAIAATSPPSVTLTFADTVAPEIDVAAPVDGATYVGGEPVMAGFSCGDDGSGVAACDGTVADGQPLDMSPGEHTFAVVATDRSGNRREVTTRYTVLGEPVSPGMPALPPADDADPSSPGPVDEPPAGAARPTVKLRSFDCGRRTCRVAFTLGGDVHRLRAELAGDGRRVIKSGAAQAGARRVVLRRPRGDVYSLALTAIGPNGATVTVRRTVRP
jgi:hypothetical protein